jgi:hypothetical protein
MCLLSSFVQRVDAGTGASLAPRSCCMSIHNEVGVVHLSCAGPSSCYSNGETSMTLPCQQVLWHAFAPDRMSLTVLHCALLGCRVPCCSAGMSRG